MLNLKRRTHKLRMQLYRMKQQALKTSIAKKSVKRAKCTKKIVDHVKAILDLTQKLSLYLQGPALQFVISQVRMSMRKSRGRRWNVKDKTLALSLLHSSPKTYRLLRKVFALPSVSTLRKIVQKVQIYPGFSGYIIEALKLKTSSMPATSKLVSVVIDEMAIKEGLTYDKHRDVVEGFADDTTRGSHIANHAIVFMVRGIIEKWKLPVGYFLSSGPMAGSSMKELLMECLTKLEQIGLNVVLMVSDQGSNNINLFQTLLGVTSEKPYFVHSDKKIFVMYDPPHLVKSIRNNLKKNGFTFDGKDVMWEHIREFYDKDSTKPIRMAPRLTKKHIELPPFAPLRVRPATLR